MDTKKNESLQGLRAYLAALVVATHCQFLKQGGVAVHFFFCLSGFLAVRPFSENDDYIKSIGDFGRYYLKKARAIIPAYWLVILLVKLLTDETWYTWKSLFRTMFFIECPGHFWYIQQTVFMYLVTPLLLLFLQGIGKLIKNEKRYLVQAGILIIISILLYIFFTSDVFYLLGNDQHQRFRIWAYLMGMAFGLIYKYISQKSFRLNNGFASVCSIILLAFPVLSSGLFLGFINPDLATYQIGWNKPMLCTIVAGFLILILLLNQECIGAMLLSLKPLIKLGNVSYETYILHWFFVSGISWSEHHYRNFLLVYIVTISVATALKKAIDYCRVKLNIFIKRILAYIFSIRSHIP